MPFPIQVPTNKTINVAFSCGGSIVMFKTWKDIFKHPHSFSWSDAQRYSAAGLPLGNTSR